MKTTFFSDLDLLYHDAESGFTARDFNAIGQLIYSWDSPPRFAIWFFGDSLWNFDLKDVRSIAEPSQSTFAVRGRENGKTAVVAHHPATFGRARQYIAYSDPASLPFPQEVFRSLEAALAWIGSSASELEHAEPEVIYQSLAD